ncbi:hypothetical protein C484_16989 [Natrialba taiwanensis DSM 12281]|uniref:Uncharacterized protein n=1 Tax=Natrialba taiwanensis DSM 12281 TaxID=1230458 RepID=L9ZRE5_9EURY|nr:hypothetical protein C484_16989 [Natrialba taiwanensis DSM 12281]
MLSISTSAPIILLLGLEFTFVLRDQLPALTVTDRQFTFECGDPGAEVNSFDSSGKRVSRVRGRSYRER